MAAPAASPGSRFSEVRQSRNSPGTGRTERENREAYARLAPISPLNASSSQSVSTRRDSLRPNSSHLIRNDLPAHGGFTASFFDPRCKEQFDARRRQSRDALEKENHHETHYGTRISCGNLDLVGQRLRTCPGACVQGSVRLHR